ncbi:hypothetical protein Si091_01956 [Streptococcus infantarius subsp. infantarius]|nr:hypothetical protein [Streptococcus infantarius subsp. infantarius]
MTCSTRNDDVRVLGNLACNVFFITDGRIKEDNVFRSVDGFFNVIPASYPVIDSSDIPANTVTSGCVGEGHELRKTTTSDHVCPCSCFLLQVLPVEQSLEEIRCVMASLTDFNAHVIKVVEDNLTSTSQLTK